MTAPLNLRRNAVWGVLEILISAAVLFFLYRMVLARLGLQALGIWSLVLATTSLVRLGDVGAATGLGRFVAIAHHRGEATRALGYIETAIITNLVLYGAISCLLYWPLCFALPYAVAPASLATARALLPYALASFTLLNVNGAVAGSLMGLQRADLKSLVTVASLLLQFAVAAVLTRSHGLIGLALAQIAQYSLALGGGWALILRQLHLDPRLPSRWERAIFRELLGFGVKLQAANIVSFLYEPATKFVLSSVGGLAVLGVYELAQKLVQQVRQIVVGPSQILMPAFARSHDQGGGEVAVLYEKAVATSTLVGLPLMLGVAATSPLICWLWMGHLDLRFVDFVVLLCAAWFCNLFAAPAYLLGVGTGSVGWNIAGHVVTSGGGPLAGLLLGRFAGAYGVVIAACVALAAGSLLSMIMNCRQHRIAPLPSLAGIRAAMRQLLKRPAQA